MKIRQATTQLSSLSPLSQSGFTTTEKLKDETHDEHALRIWKEKMHVDNDGMVYIPGQAFKYSIDEAAKRMAVPTGKAGGKELFGKYFQAGVAVPENLITNVKADEVQPVRVMCSSGGSKTGGTRVPRYFPHIPAWKGIITITVFDETISQELLEKTVDYAGIFIGVGQNRPENQGSYGRFKAAPWKWSELS